MFIENGEEGCPELNAAAGSLALTAVSGALGPWNGDGAAEVAADGKDNGALGSAKGLFDAIDDCCVLVSFLNIVDCVETSAAGLPTSGLAFGNMDVWPKVAPENAEDAKGFLDSADDAGDDGLNSVEGAAATVAGVSVFWLGSDGLEKENGDGAVNAPAPEENTDAGFSAAGASGGEVLGLKSVDCAGVVTAGASVFWVDSDGLGKENGDGAVKGLGPVDTEPGPPFGNTEAGWFAVDGAGGNKLGLGNVGAGQIVVGASSSASAGFGKTDEEVEAEADGEGPAGVNGGTAALSVVSGCEGGGFVWKAEGATLVVTAKVSAFSGSFGNENGFGEEVKGDGAAGVTVVEGIEVANGFEGGDAILDG